MRHIEKFLEALRADRVYGYAIFNLVVEKSDYMRKIMNQAKASDLLALSCLANLHGGQVLAVFREVRDARFGSETEATRRVA